MANRAIAIPASVAEVDVETRPVRGTVVKSRWARNLLTFLMVLGPGLIVMVADNDAGAVSTYTQAGAQYGTNLLWLVLLLLPVCYFIQEMVVRLGIATGRGHAAMIYQRFGKWWGMFSLVDLELVNFLTLVTEFAAIDLALTKLGVDPRVGLPAVAAGLILIAISGSYRRWERIVVFLCLLDLAWFVVTWKLHPAAGEALRATFVPGMPAGGITLDFMFLVIAVVGTTIAPWQLFFQQSCIADKRLRYSDVPWARLDTFVGACITITVAACMMLVGNASRLHGFHFTDPAQMAVDLGTFSGPFVRNVILLMMINAAVLGTTAISLSSAWAYGEVKGWPHSLQLPFKQARGFYVVYLACVAAAAAIVLIPRAPLQLIILGVQVLAGVILPSAVIFLQLLLNDRELLGDYANKRWNNIVNWSIIILLFVLSLILAAQVVAPNLFPSSGGTT
jgi:Mn2+/Fe2+ NRAMP family transporter